MNLISKHRQKKVQLTNDGSKVECDISHSFIGGVAEAAVSADKFSGED